MPPPHHDNNRACASSAAQRARFDTQRYDYDVVANSMARRTSENDSAGTTRVAALLATHTPPPPLSPLHSRAPMRLRRERAIELARSPQREAIEWYESAQLESLSDDAKKRQPSA